MGLKGWWNSLKSTLGLSLSLAKAGFKLRNEGSYLGIVWYLLEPVLLFLIILFLQSFFNGGVIQNYPIYLLIGLIMFNFFSQTTTLAIMSITSKSKFVTNIRVNYQSLVLASFIQSVYSHFFEVLILFFFFFLYKVPMIGIFYYIFIFIFLAIFTLGLSFLLAIIGVYVSDLQNVWRVLMRLLWFATPIFYFVKKDSIFFSFNPIYYFIKLTRSLIIENQIIGLDYLFILFLSLIMLIFGILIFNRYKSKIAEYL
jgi:ABC-type polysaccharide/polyol phosphate export permease